MTEYVLYGTAFKNQNVDHESDPSAYLNSMAYNYPLIDSLKMDTSKFKASSIETNE